MFDSPFIKDFKKIFDKFAYRYSGWDVWRDFVTLTACTISNCMDQANSKPREARYMEIIKTYSENEVNYFPELFGITTLALEDNPDQDFLGDLYCGLGLNKKGYAQFFTPYHIGKLMANISFGNLQDEISRKGYISAYDPCCGAGCLLIAMANAAKEQGVNYQQDVFFEAQDIDNTAALMCYIQLSLLGCAAEVRVGNSLTIEPLSPENIWHTPFYFLEVWEYRRIAAELSSILSQAEKKTVHNKGVE